MDDFAFKTEPRKCGILPKQRPFVATEFNLSDLIYQHGLKCFDRIKKSPSQTSVAVRPGLGIRNSTSLQVYQ